MRGHEISYGKAGVPVYRAYARPLTGLAPIPESPFTGRHNVLFACEVDVEVFGDSFLPAYTEGDNSGVVATDSMKNFILRQALEYDGATLEGYLDHLGRGFLETWPQMEALSLTGRELRFEPARVPGAGADGGFGPSTLVLGRSYDDYGVAELAFARDDGRPPLADLLSGRVELELLKVSGSAFTRFVRDDYTTLPERVDRPLFVALDVHWRYGDPHDAVSSDPARYVASEQVRDCVAAVFHEFVSESIQHLANAMGERLLERFPQIEAVSFDARNLTREPVATAAEDGRVKVYSDPFPAAGTITLTLSRDEDG